MSGHHQVLSWSGHIADKILSITFRLYRTLLAGRLSSHIHSEGLHLPDLSVRAAISFQGPVIAHLGSGRATANHWSLAMI